MAQRPRGRGSDCRIIDFHRSMGSAETNGNAVGDSSRSLVPHSQIESAIAPLHEEVMHGRRLARDRIVQSARRNGELVRQDRREIMDVGPASFGVLSAW
jgi:hypothetical protein